MAQYGLSKSLELQTLTRTTRDQADSRSCRCRGTAAGDGFSFKEMVKSMYRQYAEPGDGALENSAEMTAASESPVQVKSSFSSSRLSNLTPEETARIRSILFSQWNPCDSEKASVDASTVNSAALSRGLRTFNRIYFNRDNDSITPETTGALLYLEGGNRLIDYRDSSGKNPFAEKTSEGLALYERVRRQGLLSVVSEAQKVSDSERLDVVAAAKVLQSHGFKGTEQKLVKLATHIESAAKTHKVDPYLITAVIAQESAFNPGAVSACGAQGLMQLMPGTAREQGVCNPFNIKENIMGGTRYLSRMISSFADVPKALAAYNAGPGSVQRFGGVPPFTETVNYVSKISKLYKSLKSGIAAVSGSR